MADAGDDGDLAPAARLSGLMLPSGWRVGSRIERLDGQTGGAFSVGYLASKGSDVAFLKAIDFSSALEQDDLIAALGSAIEAYRYEEDMLKLCADRKMDRIVRALDSGFVQVDRTKLGRVPYLLFEPAEGDIRKAIISFGMVDQYWAVSLIHEVSVGLQQLHFASIAHQDLKPSNVLVFAGPDTFKLTDLGCSSQKDRTCPRDGLRVPGGWSVSAPELQYGELASDWIVRRVANDLYSLGSLAVFLFAGLSMNAAVKKRIADGKDPYSWRGTYRDVLPFVRQAFDEAFGDIAASFKGDIGLSIFEIVKELCEPDPFVRGSRGADNSQDQYSIQRYVSRLGNIAARARYAQKVALRQ